MRATATDAPKRHFNIWRGKMNVQKLKKLRDAIADGQNVFEMNRWNTCLFGNAYRIAEGDNYLENSYVIDGETSWFAKWLEISFEEAKRITMGEWSKKAGWSIITREEAVEFLDGLISQEENGLYIEIPDLEVRCKEPELIKT
jgi:hypothetical protein